MDQVTRMAYGVRVGTSIGTGRDYPTCKKPLPTGRVAVGWCGFFFHQNSIAAAAAATFKVSSVVSSVAMVCLTMDGGLVP